MNELTQDALQDILSYDPRTGVFINLVARGSLKVGDACTTRDPKGRIKIPIFGKQYYASRLVYLYMTGELPHGVIEHINGDYSDNRLSNLKLISYRDSNLKRKKDSKNPLEGVSYMQEGIAKCRGRNDSKRKAHWRAYTDMTGKDHQRYLYRGDDFFEACCARKSWEFKKLGKRFA